MATESAATARRVWTRSAAIALVTAGLSLVSPTTASSETTSVSTPGELAAAFIDGGAIVLAADITIDDADPDIVASPDDPVTLDLDGHELTITKTGQRSAIHIPAGANLTIDDTRGGGALDAVGGTLAAGIGTDHASGNSVISIDGGTVTASGGHVGIGGPRIDVMIAGGSVEAIGGEPGDGGPHDGRGMGIAGAHVIITGGDIDARGRSDGSGIGTFGQGEISIRDATVAAIGEQDGAGIGSGQDSEIGDIEISSSRITASNHRTGAGIGSGERGTVGTITIDNSSITATNDYTGAGIGTGFEGVSSDITIIDSVTDARNGYDGAGIGSGEAGNVGTITIEGGTVTAAGDQDGAGIGSGRDGHAGDITIHADTVTARSERGGAGIGSGISGAVGAITVTVGTITAESRDGAGIGGGRGSDGGIDTTIGTDATVRASSANGSAIGSGVGGAPFRSLTNAGTVILPAGEHIDVPTATLVDNSGLIRGDGELRGSGEIANSGSIWHTIDVSLDVTENDHLLAFDANGSTGGPNGAPRVYAASLADAGLDLPTAEPSRTGSTFAGWFDGPDHDAPGTDGPLDANSPLGDGNAGPAEPVEVTWYAGWTVQPLAITTTDLPDGRVDDAYDTSIHIDGSQHDHRRHIPRDRTAPRPPPVIASRGGSVAAGAERFVPEQQNPSRSRTSSCPMPDIAARRETRFEGRRSMILRSS